MLKLYYGQMGHVMILMQPVDRILFPEYVATYVINPFPANIDICAREALYQEEVVSVT